MALRALSVSRALATYAAQQRCGFTAAGVARPALRVFAPDAFLPVVALHADVKCRELLGRPLAGLDLRPDAVAALGVYAEVEPLTGDDDSALRLALFTHSAQLIFGIREDVVVECTPVYEAYADGLLSHLEKGGRTSWPAATVTSR